MDLTWLDIRNIQIDVYDVERKSLHIPNVILNNVTFVSLLSIDIEFKAKKEPVPLRSIHRILSSIRQISALQLDLQFLMVNLNDVFDSSDVIKNNLKNLKHLNILGRIEKFCPTTYLIEDEFLPYLIRNFDQFASTLQLLESLHLPLFFFCRNELNPEFKIKSTTVSLLHRSHDSLKELSLPFVFWDDILLPVTFPRLTSLSATVTSYREQDSLKDFLASTNLKSLLELEVTVKRKNGFRKNLFDVIRKRSPSLKKLHLQAPKFPDEAGNEISKVNWTFLGEMKCLKDFQLRRPRCFGPHWESYGNGTLLLESLPKNQLERLCLRGIGAKYVGFWRTKRHGIEAELPLKLDLFRGFRNLKSLSLRHCPDAVDDDILSHGKQVRKNHARITATSHLSPSKTHRFISHSNEQTSSKPSLSWFVSMR